eukprot:766545-Hanusia_phi.AAC.7
MHLGGFVLLHRSKAWSRHPDLIPIIPRSRARPPIPTCLTLLFSLFNCDLSMAFAHQVTRSPSHCRHQRYQRPLVHRWHGRSRKAGPRGLETGTVRRHPGATRTGPPGPPPRTSKDAARTLGTVTVGTDTPVRYEPLYLPLI